MTAYKRNVLTWACFMAIQLSAILLALYLSNWFLVPLVAAMFVIPSILRRIVCPKCGTPVTYQGTFAGIRIPGGFIRRKCRQCGWDLNTNP
jgi:hypothetical protein